MSEKLYETLEVCLQAMETGADIGTVLKRYPQMADVLRPVLEASLQAKSLAAPSVPEDAMRRGRARVLQHAAEMRASAPGLPRPFFSFPRLAVSLALAFIFILSGTGLVRASNGALPGDNLYPVKRTVEDVRLLFVFNPVSREALESEFEQERLDEIDELLAEGRHETIVFSGLVEEQNGDQWVVSGISVQITPDSKLPAEPVTVGLSIMVEGRTNAQGFVEAERVEILDAAITLPPLEPVEIETPEEPEQNENLAPEDNINGDGDEVKIETTDDNQNSSSDEAGNENDNINGSANDGADRGDSGSNSNSDGRDGGDSGGDDNSGSGGGGDDGDDD